MNVTLVIDIDWAFNQLIRGMGIVSSLTLHNDPAPFLAPKVFQTAVNSYFEPITAFDSLLFAAKNSIAKVANPLSTFPRYPGTDLEGFLKVVASSKEPFAAGSSLLSFVSSDALFAGEYENRMFLVKSVVLTDPIPLLPLTWTLSQVNGTLDFYNKNPESDFALTLDFGRPGLSFRGHLAHIRKSTLIGPNTLRILEHVGYRTFENALPSIFVPNLKFGTPSFIPQDAQYVVETDGGMLAESIFGPPEPNYGA